MLASFSSKSSWEVVIGEKGKLGVAGKLTKNYSEKPLGISEPILLLIELRESGGETFCLCFPLFPLLSCIETSDPLLLCGRNSNLRGGYRVYGAGVDTRAAKALPRWRFCENRCGQTWNKLTTVSLTVTLGRRGQ